MSQAETPRTTCSEPKSISAGVAGDADAQLLAKLVQLLGARETQSLLLSDLGALLTGPLRNGVKEKGGLRSWLQRYPDLFPVYGQPGRETVTLNIAKTKQAAEADVRPTLPDKDTDAKALQEEEDNYAAVQMRGLPYRATVPDIRKFLGSHCDSLKGEQAVQLVLNRDGRPSGLARVQFDTPATARLVKEELHLKSIDVQGFPTDRYVEVFMYTNKLRFKRPPVVPKGMEGSFTDDAEAHNVNKEQVFTECREHMETPGKAQLLLSMLGVALSEGSRAFLKRTNQGLKHFLAQYPCHFSVDGQKGREIVSYIPQAGNGGDLPRSVTEPTKRPAPTDLGAYQKSACDASARTCGVTTDTSKPVIDHLEHLKRSPPAFASGSIAELKPSLRMTPKQSFDGCESPQFTRSSTHVVSTPSDWGTPQQAPVSNNCGAGLRHPQVQDPFNGMCCHKQQPMAFPMTSVWPMWNGGMPAVSMFCPDALRLPAQYGQCQQPQALRFEGLPADFTQQDLFVLFGKYDMVEHIAKERTAVQVVPDRDSKATCHATVVMDSPEAAVSAQAVLHGQVVGTTTLAVEFDTKDVDSRHVQSASEPMGPFTDPNQQQDFLSLYARIPASTHIAMPGDFSAAFSPMPAPPMVSENPQCPTAMQGDGASSWDALWEFLTKDSTAPAPSGPAQVGPVGVAVR